MSNNLETTMSAEDLEALLKRAEESAYFSWDVDFANSIRNSLSEFGAHAVVTDDEVWALQCIVDNSDTIPVIRIRVENSNA